MNIIEWLEKSRVRYEVVYPRTGAYGPVLRIRVMRTGIGEDEFGKYVDVHVGPGEVKE